MVRLNRFVIGGLTLLLAFAQQSFSQAIPTPQQILSGASSTLSNLSPLSVAANALLGSAIDKGNDALAERLRQAQGIIDSAIFNLNQILQERVQDLDEKVRVQRMETINELNRLSQQMTNTLGVSIDQLDTVLSQNITGLQNALGNSIASLPIPTQPLVNVSRDHALAVIATASGDTTLFITGSGLYKDGKQPQAFIHDGSTDTHGTQLVVKYPSMGMVAVVIPPALIPSTAVPKEYQLSLGLNKGALVYGANYVWPSFPVLVCGVLPRYVAHAKLTASDGAYWEKSTSGQRSFYIDSGSQMITASMMVEAPWQLDVDRLHSGMDIVWNPPNSPGGAGEHSEQWGIGGFGLWVGGHGGNNSHVIAFAAIKKVTAIPQCGSSQVDLSLEYTHVNQLHLDKTAAIGSCDVAVKTPNIKAVVDITRGGTAIETVNLQLPIQNSPALGGQMLLSVDSEGLLNIALKPYCTRSETLHYRLEK
jgi:hypothetical protein